MVLLQFYKGAMGMFFNEDELFAEIAAIPGEGNARQCSTSSKRKASPPGIKVKACMSSWERSDSQRQRNEFFNLTLAFGKQIKAAACEKYDSFPVWASFYNAIAIVFSQFCRA